MGLRRRRSARHSEMQNSRASELQNLGRPEVELSKSARTAAELQKPNCQSLGLTVVFKEEGIKPPPENKQSCKVDDGDGAVRVEEQELRGEDGGRELDLAAEEDPRDEDGGGRIRAPCPLDGVGEELLRG
ncbi:hypothetical protein Vadar_005473 [Vaccinium darrowii]|uniref:Uncharacterized protein n=1 Tax=Vaccinium darrowii TaxID=229202 RepID=A0ACB7XFJ0_9ERIC|nr:hypothetical protein Vadar_005473 [Vaccinium darrowii]